MCFLSGAVGPMRLPSHERTAVFRTFMPWARTCAAEATFVLNVYYEQRFRDTLDGLRSELGVTLPPGREAAGGSGR